MKYCRMFSSSPFQFLVFFIFLVLFELSLSQSNPDMYKICRDNLYNCGNFSASYPFWGKDRPEGCGHPNLGLKCENDNTTILEMENVSYHVLHMDVYTQSLQIGRQDYLNGFCSPKLANTTLSPVIFDYASDYRILTFYYGCSPLSSASTAPNWFTCPEIGSGYVSEGWQFLGTCNNSITVPVLQSLLPGAVITGFARLEQALKEGFEVKWKFDNAACNQDCIASNGTCGFNSSGPICYCAQPPYSGFRECQAPNRPGWYL